MGFAIIDSCIIARAIRLITKVTTGQTLVAKTRHFSIIDTFSPGAFKPAVQPQGNAADRPFSVTDEDNIHQPNRNRSESTSTFQTITSSAPTAVCEDIQMKRANSPYTFSQPCVIAPAVSYTPRPSTHNPSILTLPLPPQSVNRTSPRTMSRRIWHAVLLFTFFAIVFTVIMQELSRSQRLWPVMDIGSCQPDREFIPFYIWRGLMALLAPVLIWKLRNVNDAHGIRRDLILTAISTMTIDVMFAVSTTLQSKFTFWKAYIYPGYWVILHLTVIHISSVIMPIVQSFRDDRDRDQNVNLDRSSFDRVLRTPSLLEEFKQLAIADFCVESVLFLESYNALLHLLPPLMRPTTLTYVTLHPNSTTNTITPLPLSRSTSGTSTPFHPTTTSQIPISLSPPTQSVPPSMIPFYLQFYSTFIQQGSPLEVNIPDKCRRKVGYMIEKGCFEVGMFGECEGEVRENLFRNTFFKFVGEKEKERKSSGKRKWWFGRGVGRGIDVESERDGNGGGSAVGRGKWWRRWRRRENAYANAGVFEDYEYGRGVLTGSRMVQDQSAHSSRTWNWWGNDQSVEEQGRRVEVDTLIVLPRRDDSLFPEGMVGGVVTTVQAGSWGQISILELQSVGRPSVESEERRANAFVQGLNKL
ncbi:hypothetical protein HK097_011299 [Rhizophlyctis rosea]|uniref:RGS domain-containing protein n=1 Tax=Rhizophlyctis rosea TaxID=64517 RepID=A0AAD5S897_9FUNG|nr:hypothetical protein HK097_011299 [Rhizophlyctis rosea]